MALALGVHQNDIVYIGDIPVEAVELHGYSFALLKVSGKFIKVDDQKAVEVLPTVFISCGKPSQYQIEKHADRIKEAHEDWEKRRNMSQEEAAMLPPKVELPDELLPRLLIDAPRSVVILREALWLRNRNRNV